MKRPGVLSARLLTVMYGLIAVGASVFLALTGEAKAACAAPATNYGSVSSSLSIEKTGTYRIWSRLMAADSSNNSYLLEIDGGSCFVVGDANIAPGQWTWTDYHSGNPASKINVNLTAGKHTIKMIGRELNVKVDRVLAVGEGGCSTGPSGMGDNCTIQADTTPPVVNITAPADGGTVSGQANITATASDNKAVTKVDFFVDNVIKGTDTTAPYSYAWDTSNAVNGVHNVSVKAYDAAGNVGTDTNTLVVKNGDAQPPSVPANVKASAKSSSQIALTWSPSTDNVAVTGYFVVRDGYTIAETTTNSYTDNGVTPNRAYSYQIKAYDAAGNRSAASAGAPATTPPAKDTQAPSAPANLTAKAKSSTQVDLAWSPSTDNIAVVAYDVYRSVPGGVPSLVVSATTTSFGDTGLKAGTQYFYYIVAKDANGNKGGKSVTQSVSTLPAPAKPPVSGGQKPGGAKTAVTVRGKVVDRRGNALPGAKVTATADGKRYVSIANKSGVYRLEGMPAGRYHLHYSKQGYAPGDEVFSLKNGDDKVWNMRLYKNSETRRWYWNWDWSWLRQR